MRLASLRLASDLKLTSVRSDNYHCNVRRIVAVLFPNEYWGVYLFPSNVKAVWKMSTKKTAPGLHPALDLERITVRGKSLRHGQTIGAATLALFLAGSVALSAETPLHGKWMREDRNAVVTVGPCGPQLCATNIWIGETSWGEEVGDRLVMTLEQASDGVLTGEGYDPKRDLTVKVRLEVSETQLVSRGCILLGLLCKTVSWQRVDAR